MIFCRREATGSRTFKLSPTPKTRSDGAKLPHRFFFHRSSNEQRTTSDADRRRACHHHRHRGNHHHWVYHRLEAFHHRGRVVCHRQACRGRAVYRHRACRDSHRRGNVRRRHRGSDDYPNRDDSPSLTRDQLQGKYRCRNTLARNTRKGRRRRAHSHSTRTDKRAEARRW